MLAKKCLLVGIVTLFSVSLAIADPPAVHPVTGEELVIDCLRGTPDAIDGDLSDWNLEAMTPAVLDVVEQLHSGQDSWDGPEDCSGDFYLLWDDENIYIAVVVKDDKSSMNKTGGSIWNADAVEVFFSTTNAVPPHAEHYQWGFNANDQKWNWGDMEGAGNSEPDYLEVASSITGDGYICEVSIPYSEITPLDWSIGSTIGFHPVFDDTDNGDRELQMTWTGREAHDQSLGFGHMILSADSVPEPEDPNPVAWWPLNEGAGTTAVDASGNGHDGTLLLDPQWVAGQFGGALEFAGLSGQRVEMEGYEGILGTQNRTVMAWIKTTEMGDWISWGQNTNTQKWIGRINDNAGNGAVGAYRTEVSGGYIISTTVLTDGEWHYVTSVLESAGSPTIEDVKMYVDGALEAVSGVRPVGIDTVGGRNVWIGDGHHDRPLPGVIDDVRIYNRALTKLEIVAALEGVERVDMEIGFATPVIDGQIDYAWEGASTQYFAPLDDPANASGSWKALYDSENLYVMVDVTDDSLQNDSASSWQDDSVELYFDGGNTKVNTALSGDDHQYTFGWTTDDIQGTNIDGATEGIEHAQVDTDTGWRIEIKLPWLSIQGAAPQVRDLIGIDCYYNDDDDGGDSREGKMLTFSAEEFWNDASGWGTAVLGVIPQPVDPGTDGLVAFYALENDVLDSSGNGNDGTIVGAPTFVDGQAGYGMAMEFDGESYVDGGNDASLDVTGPISIALWIRPGADDPEGQGTATAPLAKALSGASPSWSWQVRYGWNSPQPYMAFTFNTSPRAWAYVGKNLERNEWAHIACSHDGATLKCYLNGEEADSTPMGAITSSSTPLLIGSDGWRSDWIGAIDEVAIYNRDLSEGELLYLAGFRETVVLNPSFEDDEAILDDPDWEQWATWNPVEGAGSNATIVDTDSIDGARSLRIEPKGAENWHFIVLSQPIFVDTNKNYNISFWAKAEEPRPLTLALKAEDNSIAAWGDTSFDLTTEWAEYTFASEVLIDTIKIEIWCAGSEVPFWLDQVSVH